MLSSSATQGRFVQVSGKESISEGSAAPLTASGPKAELGEVLCSHRFQGYVCIRMILLIP